jgi:protein phosphatase
VEAAFVMSVADGMGGEVFGELASRLALTTALELGSREGAWIQNVVPLSLDQMREKATAFATLLHEAFLEQARLRPETAEMGTTLTIAYVVGQQAFIGHAGDSRAYRVRGSEIIRLTRDHTLAEEFRAAGNTSPQVARWKNVLTHYLAEGQELELDVNQIALGDGDSVLLCTDGLSDLADDEEIAAAVNSAASPQAACDALVALALERGGKDNVTVVIGRFGFPAQ